MNEEVKHTPAASATCNGDFILIESYSGYRSYSRDPDAAQHFLQMDASDDAIGQAVLMALLRSRQITRAEIGTYFDYTNTMKQHAQWIADLMQRYGYKTKRALFKKMMSVPIRQRNDEIEFSPMRHEKLETWGREKNDGVEDVLIPVSSMPAEIGAALRLAFSRCS